MRGIADRLLARFAPKASADAACIGKTWSYCSDGELHFVDACGNDRVVGTC